jgi:hypothetical protein
MKNKIALAILVLSAIGSAQISHAQVLIDDFSSGTYQSPQFKTGTHTSSQNGTMLGLNRSTSLSICTPKICAAANPYKQAISYAFLPTGSAAPAAMIQSVGYGAGPRIDMGYGFGVPMDQDLSSADRIQIHFLGLTQVLNFNLQIFTGSSWGQNGCNLLPSTVPFTVELPYTGFFGTGFDKAHVNFLNFIFQNGSPIGGTNFAIASIKAVQGGETGAIVCHLN